MIVQALKNIRPKAEWRLEGDAYEGLFWLDSKQSKPSKEELMNEVARLLLEYENNKYQRERANAYPSIVDQLDTLYHGGYDAWKATIEAVKLKYPKE